MPCQQRQEQQKERDVARAERSKKLAEREAELKAEVCCHPFHPNKLNHHNTVHPPYDHYPITVYLPPAPLPNPRIPITPRVGVLHV